jgi:hypothetical protein
MAKTTCPVIATLVAALLVTGCATKEYKAAKQACQYGQADACTEQVRLDHDPGEHAWRAANFVGGTLLVVGVVALAALGAAAPPTPTLVCNTRRYGNNSTTACY